MRCTNVWAVLISLSLTSGIIYIKRLNFSGNTCQYQPAVLCDSSSPDEDGFVFSFQYCNVHKNIATYYMLFQISSTSFKSNIMFTNVIGNEQKGEDNDGYGEGIITNDSGEMEIKVSVESWDGYLPFMHYSICSIP